MKTLLATFLLSLVFIQTNPTDTPIRAYRKANEHRILREFINLLSIPNVASDRENIRRNATLIMEMMQRRGLEPRLLEAKTEGVPPVVFGEWKVPGATRTLALYAHYDGQPTDPQKWTGTKPWTPSLRSKPLESGGEIIPFPGQGDTINPEWRLYGRSTSDDKAGVFAILTAVDAMRNAGMTPSSNIKFFFEGEEEAGSPHLHEILTEHKRLLGADIWVICDGPVHQSGRRQVVFGVRGDTNVELTVYGAGRPLHSGHYGNWAPNPAMTLARLLASMKDESGRVTIDAWYDDTEPLGELERQAIADAPAYDEELRSQLGLAQTEGGGAKLLERINLPGLNINGITSAETGELARNVIPTTAVATLDLRLVKGNDYRRQVEKLRAHIRKQGFHLIERDPTADDRRKFPLIVKFEHVPGGYNAQRTRMDLPAAASVVAAIQAVSKEKVVRLPTSGGSLPLAIFNEALGVEALLSVPIANYDNNQHAENENIRLQNLWDGIEMIAALMSMK